LAKKAIAPPAEAIFSVEEIASAKPKAPRNDIIRREAVITVK